MTDKKITSIEQHDKLIDSLVNDIIELKDEEVLDEAKIQHANPPEEVNRLRKIINTSILHAAKAELNNAKNQLNDYNSKTRKNNIIPLSINEKRRVIESFTSQDSELTKKLTLAARKGEGIETEKKLRITL